MAPRLENLTETGMVKYFFHSPSSTLPIRDVLNEQGNGFKTEPHIERSAENYLKPCYQVNIRRFAGSERKYLFLTTTCRNKSMSQSERQYIVGFIEKKEVEERPSPKGGEHLAIIGPTVLYSFGDAILVADVFNWRCFSRPLLQSSPWVNERKTKQILEHFSSKANIIDACVSEVMRLNSLLLQ